MPNGQNNTKTNQLFLSQCSLRQKPAIRGDICSESPPKVCEIDMAQGEDMSKGPGTEEIMFLSAFILEI